MTKKAEKGAKKDKPKPRVKKERLRDLDAKDKADAVKGGVTKSVNECMGG